MSPETTILLSAVEKSVCVFTNLEVWRLALGKNDAGGAKDRVVGMRRSREKVKDLMFGTLGGKKVEKLVKVGEVSEDWEGRPRKMELEMEMSLQKQVQYGESSHT